MKCQLNDGCLRPRLPSTPGEKAQAGAVLMSKQMWGIDGQPPHWGICNICWTHRFQGWLLDWCPPWGATRGKWWPRMEITLWMAGQVWHLCQAIVSEGDLPVEDCGLDKMWCPRKDTPPPQVPDHPSAPPWVPLTPLPDPFLFYSPLSLAIVSWDLCIQYAGNLGLKT